MEKVPSAIDSMDFDAKNFEYDGEFVKAALLRLRAAENYLDVASLLMESANSEGDDEVVEKAAYSYGYCAKDLESSKKPGLHLELANLYPTLPKMPFKSDAYIHLKLNSAMLFYSIEDYENAAYALIHASRKAKNYGYFPIMNEISDLAIQFLEKEYGYVPEGKLTNYLIGYMKEKEAIKKSIQQQP